MYEVELKVRSPHEQVRRALQAAGATRTGAVSQEDVYYDAPHREFAETDEALRVRRERRQDGDVETAITYKGPLIEEESKTREELESGIDDADAVDTMLERLGFDPVGTVRKERERYDLDGFTVTLDEVESLGSFVEIEREAGDDEREAVRDEARDRLEELGLDPTDQIRTSYLGLLLQDE